MRSITALDELWLIFRSYLSRIDWRGSLRAFYLMAAVVCWSCLESRFSAEPSNDGWACIATLSYMWMFFVFSYHAVGSREY